MTNSLTEKPNVFGSMVALIFFAAIAAIEFIANPTGTIELQKNTLIYILGAIISLVMGLAANSYSKSKKLSKKAQRKERIAKWLNDIDSAESINEFYDSITYLELKELLSRKERAQLSTEVLYFSSRVNSLDGANRRSALTLHSLPIDFSDL